MKLLSFYKKPEMRRSETTSPRHAIIEFTPQQERMHAVLHLLGVIFGIIAVPLLIYSALSKDIYSIVGTSVYGICYLMVFSFSSLYHASTDKKIKRLYKKLDRISIYFLIAGTYTPLIQFYVFSDMGMTLLKVVWCLVVIGIYFEVQYPDRFRLISIIFYLVMGLLFMFFPVNLLGAMPAHIASLMLGGVILYVIGVVFYVSNGWKYHHAAWHIFVLSASICHYLAVLYTL